MENKNLTHNWGEKSQISPKREDNPIWGNLGNIEKVFDNFFKDFGNMDVFLPKLIRDNMGNYQKIAPRMDISENDKEYILEADLPGVKSEDLDISVSKDGMLTVKGKRENQEEQKERNYHRIERSYGSFERSIMLPDNSDHDNVNASFENGILVIKIPKSEQSPETVRKIQIK